MSSVVDRLRQAAEDVKSAELPADLRAAGFVLAFWSGEQPVAEGGALGDGASSDSVQGQGSNALAKRLNVGSAVLEKLYDFEDDEVAIIAPRRAFNDAKTGAAGEIAHLVVAARQTVFGDEWVAVERLRAACDDMGVLDGNFGRVINQLNGEGFRVRGGGKNREIKMNSTGFEASAAIAQQVASLLS